MACEGPEVGLLHCSKIWGHRGLVGFRGFRVWGLGPFGGVVCRGLGCRGLGCRGLGFRVWGFGLQGLGIRVYRD